MSFYHPTRPSTGQVAGPSHLLLRSTMDAIDNFTPSSRTAPTPFISSFSPSAPAFSPSGSFSPPPSYRPDPLSKAFSSLSTSTSPKHSFRPALPPATALPTQAVPPWEEDVPLFNGLEQPWVTCLNSHFRRQALAAKYDPGLLIELNLAYTRERQLIDHAVALRDGKVLPPKEGGTWPPPRTEHADGGDPNNTTVFVGGISGDVNVHTLEPLFMVFGPIEHVKIFAHERPCGFVKYSHRADAENAVRAMQGFKMGDCNLRPAWGRTSNRHAEQTQATPQVCAERALQLSEAMPASQRAQILGLIQYHFGGDVHDFHETLRMLVAFDQRSEEDRCGMPSAPMARRAEQPRGRITFEKPAAKGAIGGQRKSAPHIYQVKHTHAPVH